MQNKDEKFNLEEALLFEKYNLEEALLSPP